MSRQRLRSFREVLISTPEQLDRLDLAIENGWNLEWRNPALLAPYLPAGAVLEVQQDGKYEVRVRAQSFR